MKKYFLSALLLAFAFISQSCKKEAEPPKPNSPQNTTPPAPVYSYEVVNTWPHDPGAFTQGLQFYNGELYESTGLNGRSSLRRVELKTGKVLQKIDIENQYFAEGMTILGMIKYTSLLIKLISDLSMTLKHSQNSAHGIMKAKVGD